jgi:hypothetical protein
LPDLRAAHADTAKMPPDHAILCNVAWSPGGAYVQSVVEDRIEMDIDEKNRVELEAAVYRRLVEHLRQRTDVQNIDMMNLAGFCRNCLSNWMKEAADARGVAMTKDVSREVVYGMPYDEWRAKYQREASADQKAEFEKAQHKH